MAVGKRRWLASKTSCSCSMPGVWRAVAHNPGAAVVYHSPKACTHITGRMDLYQYYREERPGQAVYTAPLISSQIEEKHVIFGAHRVLSDCLDYVIDTYRPAYIVVANSCLSGVIGDDSEGICKEKEAETGVPILNVDARGFLDGEYYGGFFEAAKALADRFMRPATERVDGICVLGEKGGPASAFSRDLRDLLAPFGLPTEQRFPAYSSLADLAAVPRNRLLLPVGGSASAFTWMEKLAKYMTERFDQEYFPHDYPIGRQATQAWLQEFASFIGKEELAAEAIRLQEEHLNDALRKYRPQLAGKRVAIALGRQVRQASLRWLTDMLDDAGMVTTGIVFLGETDAAAAAKQQAEWDLPAVPTCTEADGEDLLNAADLILTNMELEGENYRQMYIPMVPPVGLIGLVRLYEKLYRLACRRRRSGVVLYGW